MAEAEQAWARAEILGIDTEFVRERTYRAALGLVQVSDGATAWLFDPVTTESTEPLAQLLRQPAILKVLHSGSEDLEVLYHALDTIPDPLVDTQIACAMLGQPLQMGYHHAVDWLFGIHIDKDQTRSNWCRRPLQPRQLRYAAMDVVLLPHMLAELQLRLEEAGRWEWLQEDVARMQRAARVSVDPEEAYQRIGGAGRLDESALRTLRALARWREQVAIAKDLARGFVLPDAALLDLARKRPDSMAQLKSLSALHPRALQRYGDQLITLIEQAAQDGGRVERIEPLDNRQRQQLGEMRRVVSDRAGELNVDPALLASRRELEKLLRTAAEGQEPPERFLGWRKAVVTDELLAIIG
jgi:ribonuclease D